MSTPTLGELPRARIWLPNESAHRSNHSETRQTIACFHSVDRGGVTSPMMARLELGPMRGRMDEGSSGRDRRSLGGSEYGSTFV